MQLNDKKVGLRKEFTNNRGDGGPKVTASPSPSEGGDVQIGCWLGVYCWWLVHALWTVGMCR